MFKPAWGTEAGSTLEGRNLRDSCTSCTAALGHSGRGTVEEDRKAGKLEGPGTKSRHPGEYRLLPSEPWCSSGVLLLT